MVAHCIARGRISRNLLLVLQQVFHPARPTRVAALLLHLLRTAERKPRLPPRLVGADPARDQVSDALILVKAQLFFELGFHPVSTPQPKPPRHSAPAAVIRRINPTAPVRRRQLAASTSSCALPFRVRR